MECKGLYKSLRIPSVADALAKRSQNIIAERQEKRREFFWGARVDLEHSPTVDKKKHSRADVLKEWRIKEDKKKHSRAEMLKKWRAEKMKKLEEVKKMQKPIFKVGIAQRKVTGSPVVTQTKTYFKKTVTTQPTLKKSHKNPTQASEFETTERAGVITRARAKTLDGKGKAAEINIACKFQKGLNNKFYKIEGGKKKQIESHVFKVPDVVTKLPSQGLTFPCSPKVLKRNEKIVKFYGKKVERKIQAQQKMKVNKSNADKCLMENIEEKSTQQHVDSQPQVVSPEAKTTQEDDYQPIVYSPFVTVRSEKKSKRKSKKSLSIDVEEQIKKEENEFKCRIFSFRKYLDCERKRLLEMCDKWKHIYEEFQEVPTDVEGDIDSIIGKTNLLISDKFVQFKGLIDKCENGDPFIKIDDLQGFQDWVSIEVERIDEEFHKLEKLKCNNWKCETMHVDVTTKARKVNVSKNKSKKPVGNSNIRSHILAARKLMKERNLNGGDESQLATFSVMINVLTPKQNKRSLLKDVLSSETKKKNEPSGGKSPAIRQKRNSGLEIMIATQKNKFPTPVKISPQLTDYVVFVGTENIPSKSILKKTPKTLNSSKGHVTFKKQTENLKNGSRGLSEKYFQPLTDDDYSPIRTILGDLGNITPAGVMTRSRTKQMSFSP